MSLSEKAMFNFLRKNKSFDAIKSILIDHVNQLEEKRSSIPEDVFDVTRFSLEQFLSTFESMNTLMSKQDFEGCLKLSRSILENSVNLRYIYKEDIEERSKNFKLASVKRMSDKFDALGDDHTIDAKKMNDFFQELLKDYVSEKNIREKFKAIGSDSTYVRSYKRLSEYIHTAYRPKIDFNDNGPYVSEMKRTVRSDTSLVTLMALQAVCTKYDLDGGIMMIDDPGYKGVVFFATNPKRAEEDMKKGQK